MSYKSLVELCCNVKWFGNSSDNSPTQFVEDIVYFTCGEGTLCEKVKNVTKYFVTGCRSIAGISNIHCQKCSSFKHFNTYTLYILRFQPSTSVVCKNQTLRKWSVCKTIVIVIRPIDTSGVSMPYNPDTQHENTCSKSTIKTLEQHGWSFIAKIVNSI